MAGTQYWGVARISTDSAPQDVAIGASSAACTTAFGGSTFKVRLYATSDCRIRFGKTPTALATDTYLAGGGAEYFTVNPGEKVACIQVSSSGTLNVSECA